MPCAKEKDSVQSIWTNFCQTTTAHGLSRIPGSASTVRRTLWSLLVAVCMIGAVIGVVSITLCYVKFRYTVISMNELRTNIRFPVITVCNEMPYDLARVNYSQVKDFFDSLGITNESCDSEFTFRHIRTRLDPAVRPRVLYEYNPDVTTLLGQNLEDFVIECVYQGKSCKISNVTLTVFKDPLHYNCVKVQVPNDIPIRMQEYGALSLTLYVGDGVDFPHGKYTRYLDTGGKVGVKMMIHPEGTHPYWSKVVHVTVGQMAAVVVKPREIQRLEWPYSSRCIKDPPAIHSPTTNISYTYSYQLCLLKCYNRLVAETCNCLPGPVITDTLGIDLPYCGASPCNRSKIVEKMNCKLNLTLAFQERRVSKLCPECRLPCLVQLYDSHVHMSKWPSNFRFFATASKLELQSRKIPISMKRDNSALQSYIRQNFLKVDISMKSLLTVVEMEQESTDQFTFLSNIGGLVGILMGVSVITVFEVIELICACLSKCVKRRKDKVVPFGGKL